MNVPDRLDMVPESLRKEICDFVSNNATFLFGAANNFDKVAVAKLVQDLVHLLTEQNRAFEDCRNMLFKEYRSVMDTLTLYLAFVSNEGIDIKDILEED